LLPAAENGDAARCARACATVVPPAAVALARMLRSPNKHLAGYAFDALHSALVDDSEAHSDRSVVVVSGACARATLCATLVQEDALQALLTYAMHFLNCPCEACTATLLDKLLPTLSALSASSPAALRAALHAGLMPFLEDIGAEHSDVPLARSKVCALLVCALEPAAGEAEPDDDDDDALLCWRAARTEAASAAAAAGFHVFAASLAGDMTQAAALFLGQAAAEDAVACLPYTDVLCIAADALSAFAVILQSSPAARCTAEEVAIAVHSAASLVASMGTITAIQMAADGADDDAGQRVATCLDALLKAHNAACRAMRVLLRTQPALVVEEHAATIARMACAMLQPAPGVSSGWCTCCCDPAQAAACALLAQLAVACGGGEALQRILIRDVDDDGQMNSTMPIIAALLTACAVQCAKPALRREATGALALLLAMQHAAAEEQ
jgi:hypothetical protein